MSDDKKNTEIDPENTTTDVVDVVEAEVEEKINEEEVQDAVSDALDHVEAAQPMIIKKSSFGSLLVAALLGGVATVALVAGLGYYGLTNNKLGVVSNLLNGGDAAAAMEDRYTDLTTRILSLEGDIAAAAENAPKAVDLSPLTDKVNALSDALANQADDSKANAELITSIQTSIANVADNSQGGVVDNTALIAIQTEINALKKTSTNGGNNEAVNAAIAEIKTQITAVETELAAVKSAAADSSSNMNAGEATNMASALAVASLERALQDEKPFEVELNAIKGFAGDNESLGKLSDYAASGLASEVTLLGQFNGLLEKALVADLKGEGKSIFDKFIGNAKSIISIRKTGNVEGSGTEAVLARMEVAVNDKDLAAALKTADQLDGPAKSVFADWVASANSRLAAQDLMRQVSADILTSLQ